MDDGAKSHLDDCLSVSRGSSHGGSGTKDKQTDGIYSSLGGSHKRRPWWTCRPTVVVLDVDQPSLLLVVVVLLLIQRRYLVIMFVH